MKKAPFLLFLILFSSFFVFSQDYKGKGRIFGYVYDEEGNPLEGVRVKLFSLRAQDGFSTVTDGKGKWVASWIRGGGWDVDFEKIGYMPKKISIQISEIIRNPTVEVNLKKVEGLVITKDIEQELVKGNKLFEEGKYEEAVKAYEKILEEFPDVYIVNKNIGNCYFKQEKYEKAEEYYRKVLEKAPSESGVMLAIGNSYTNRGENEKALEWYRKIEFEKLDDPIVLYNVGTNFYNNSQFKEAFKYYKKAIEIQDDFLDAIYQLGLCYLNLSQHQDAINAFENYLKHDPDSERASQVKGFLEFLKKKIEGRQV